MSHLFVIDDDDFFRDTLVQMLEREGHKVTATNDAARALEQLDRSRVDLILTDILMPGMDGMEFIMELSKRSYNTPVIAMSGGRRSLTSTFTLESAKLLGVKITLTKPFTLMELRTALEKALA